MYLSSMHAPAVASWAPQSRDRLYVMFRRVGQRAPELDVRPLAWCQQCRGNVAAVQSWMRPNRPARGRYRARQRPAVGEDDRPGSAACAATRPPIVTTLRSERPGTAASTRRCRRSSRPGPAIDQVVEVGRAGGLAGVAATGVAARSRGAAPPRLHAGGDPRLVARAGRHRGGRRSRSGVRADPVRARRTPGWSGSPARDMLAGVEHSFEPLSPVAFLDRAAAAHADRVAVVDGELRLSYRELHERCQRLAGVLAARADGRPVAVLAPNTHVLLEANFGVPWAGVPLVAINTRLAAGEVAYILEHCGAGVLVHDPVFDELVGAALAQLGRPPVLIRAGEQYERLLAEATPRAITPDDERALLSINYTSGTTGPAQGRHVPPPRGVPTGPGHGRTHRAVAVGGAPVDAAHVPLQRVVLPVGGDRGRRHPCLPTQGRAGRGLAADPGAGRHPPERGADGAVHAGLRAGGGAVRRRCGWPPGARRRVRPSYAGCGSWDSTSPTSTG